MNQRSRGYIRSFPVVFDKAEGALLFDENDNRYIDFFAGAGTLNYGHNNPAITRAMIAYLEHGGIVHGLDKATVAKRAFLQALQDNILAPRNLNYKVQFTGPTGTNASRDRTETGADGQAPLGRQCVHRRVSWPDDGRACRYRQLFLSR
ncbi:MAG: aminotransferase class III-fold pyridoxal phosphate-dependent enzyme [Woeseiaceae bacterium]|nr:aminotransferase class III-fold pyridoxal phosphate-dependent enzyme [Woeseiaceae bacterium]